MSDSLGQAAAARSSLPQSASVLRAQDYRRMRWKNGAGWTSEILRVPDADDWDWRLSIADVETDAPFSAFRGMERELVLLGGNGMRLHFDDGATHELLPPHGRLRFSGERPLVGELVDGPSRDFNVMWKHDVIDAQLWHRPLVGAMVLFVGPGETWVVHMLTGQAHFSAESGLDDIDSGDTAVLQGSGSRTRFALDGAGDVLLVRVMRLGEA